jgi:UDP-N-acetyl-D-galactosamine dehydrogenase
VVRFAIKRRPLKCWVDFHVGYSPERINLETENIVSKVSSRSFRARMPKTLEFVAAVYGAIIAAGIHKRRRSGSQRLRRSLRIPGAT